MKQTDKRAGIIDRYYMRIYDAYFKKKDPARFAACVESTGKCKIK